MATSLRREGRDMFSLKSETNIIHLIEHSEIWRISNFKVRSGRGNRAIGAKPRNSQKLNEEYIQGNSPQRTLLAGGDSLHENK